MWVNAGKYVREEDADENKDGSMEGRWVGDKGVVGMVDTVGG